MKAAFVIFDRMTALDFIGFYDAVTRLKSMKFIPDLEWRICANKREITDGQGLAIVADAVGEPLQAYDMLFVPGGFGTRTLQHDGGFIEWLKSASPVKLKISVCTGALLLGAAGFLRGKRATTHPGALQELEPYCGVVLRERIVDEGDVITAGGVATSIDLGLFVVERLAGREARSRIAAQMDYPYQWKSDRVSQEDSSGNRGAGK
ncbi:MAG: DJ-1/PfpI family protein [Betaproteobacteria bacterium]|nr:DJ-1/PfpI family protein [Betaproteobacteria bacterium]